MLSGTCCLDVLRAARTRVYVRELTERVVDVELASRAVNVYGQRPRVFLYFSLTWRRATVFLFVPLVRFCIQYWAQVKAVQVEVPNSQPAQDQETAKTCRNN